MKNVRFAIISSVLISALNGVACSDSSASPTSPSSSASGASALTSDLAGAWTLTSIQPVGQSPQLRPANATYAITFADSRLSTRTDCNVCSGAFSVSGATLTAGPNLACTRAACQTAPFESAYTAMLSGDSVAEISSSTLTLSSTRGTIQFVR